MKATLIALCAILAVTTARVVITADSHNTHHLLGAASCTWGPSYWCQNITTAAECKATTHCIKQKWEKLKVPEDRDTVCGVCKDMVEQARDQLESNQTMQDLKTVFEGSCMLIHIKPVVKECINLVDQFIPELVETLASQMNPSVVCTVAGLCNSARIDQLLLAQKKNEDGRSLENDELEPDECSKCYTVAAHIEHKFNITSRDRIADRFLNMCREMGTYSDACSAIVLTYFDTIYAHLQQNLNSENICHLSGQCASKFHKHEDDSNTTPKVEVRPLSSVGMVEVGEDLPCKLCEQLVGHLRDLLVANTTEAEFKLVLQGLCKQTHSFATECKAIVDEYYPEIYEYLTKGLNSNAVCEMSGICPQPGLKEELRTPVWALVPPQAAEAGKRIFSEKQEDSKKVVAFAAPSKKSEAEEMQLPIERMQLPLGLVQEPASGVSGKQMCALCEYLLHYIQVAVTNPNTENEVKKDITKVCYKLPKTIQNDCMSFVQNYGDAVLAIFAQEIDPSQVCPMLHLCPSEDMLRLLQQVSKYQPTVETKVEDKPSCPLCLFAMTQIYNAIKNNKTEAGIEAQLDKLCTRLPHSLVDECTDLVKGYSKELVSLLLMDFTPQEVCVYIKLCDPMKDPGPKHIFPMDHDGEIMTNEIPQSPAEVTHKTEVEEDVGCVICEFAMQYVEKAMRNKKTKDEIENVVYGICHHLPKTIGKECNDFVSEYADVIIDILAQDVSPKEVCTMMGLCKADTKKIQESVAECALCQAIISTIDKLLANPKVDQEIEEVTSKVCKYLPASKQNKCVMMMEIYEQSIINILKAHGDSRKICSMIGLCSANDYLAMSTVSADTMKHHKKWMKIWKPELAIEAKKLYPPKKYNSLL